MTAFAFIFSSLLIGVVNVLAAFAVWMFGRAGWIICVRRLRPWWYRNFSHIDGRLARVILSPQSGCSARRRQEAQDFVTSYREQVDGLLTELELSAKPQERLRLLAELKTLTASHGSFFISKRLSYRIQLQLARQALAEGHGLKEARQHLRGVGSAILFDSVAKFYQLTNTNSR
jgi:hypothetical protein